MPTHRPSKTPNTKKALATPRRPGAVFNPSETIGHRYTTHTPNAKPTDEFHKASGKEPNARFRSRWGKISDGASCLIYIAGCCDEYIDTQRPNFAVYACVWGTPNDKEYPDKYRRVCDLEYRTHTVGRAQLLAAIVALESLGEFYGRSCKLREVVLAYSGDWFLNRVVRAEVSALMKKGVKGEDKELKIDLAMLVKDIEKEGVKVSFLAGASEGEFG